MKTATAERREPFSVIVSRGLWRGHDVMIEPQVSAHPLRHFRNHTDATEVARAISALEGWPVVDRTEAADGTP